MHLGRGRRLGQARHAVSLTTLCQGQRELGIVGSRDQLNGLHLCHHSTPVGDTNGRDIGQRHVGEIGGDVGHILSRQRAPELELEAGEIARGVGRVHTDQHIARAHIAHGLQSRLQVGRQGAAVGAVGHRARHYATHLDRETAARLRHIHFQVQNLQV